MSYIVTPDLGLELPDPLTIQPFETVNVNSNFLLLEAGIVADRVRLTAAEPKITALEGWRAVAEPEIQALEDKFDDPVIVGNRIVLRHTAGMSIANDTIVPITFDITDRTDAGFSLVSSTRITVANAGVYCLQARSRMNTGATGVRRLSYRINGSSAADMLYITAPGSGSQAMSAANPALSLSAGDYVEVYHYQTSGSSQSLLDAQVSLERVA